MTVFTVFCIPDVWIRDAQAALQCEYQHGHLGSWDLEGPDDLIEWGGQKPDGSRQRMWRMQT